MQIRLVRKTKMKSDRLSIRLYANNWLVDIGKETGKQAGKDADEWTDH